MNMQQMVGDPKCRSRPYYFRRCKKERPTSIHTLPDELLFSILEGLPADYLHDRARLVCRRWYHIIRSQSFIDAHHQRSTYCLLSSIYGSTGRPFFMITATPQGLIQKNEFSYICRDKFVGTCNGLMLEMLSCENNIIILRIINPATKQALVLPPCTGHAGTATHDTYCGIAYAAASMKYKVVISFFTSSPCQSLAILSVGVDNSWRQVRVDHLPERARRLLNWEPLLAEGFMYWVDKYSWETVVTLDVETEILTTSELPSPPQNDKECIKPKFYLSTGRSLSLLIGRGEDRTCFFELWEMNLETKEWMKLKDDSKLGDQQQQLRLRQLGFRSGDYLRPRGWLKYPEVLVFSAYSSGMSGAIIISYNLDTHEINSTEFPVPVDHFILTNAMYKNSLIWLT